MIKKLHRRSIRIPGYDYTKPGMYFLTVCTKNRECLFGEVVDSVVAFFKYTSTKRINEYRQTSALPVWQRHYYEHVIRSDKTLNKIRGYIANNPMNWNFDEENPTRNPTRPLTGLSPFLIIAFFAVFIPNHLF